MMNPDWHEGDLVRVKLITGDLSEQITRALATLDDAVIQLYIYGLQDSLDWAKLSNYLCEMMLARMDLLRQKIAENKALYQALFETIPKKENRA